MRAGYLFFHILSSLLCLICSGNEGSLLQKSLFPIANLSSVTFRDVWSLSHWQNSQRANRVEVRPLIPFELWKQPNLMRLSVPYRIESNTGPGLGDVRIFDLILFPSKRTLIGVGPVVNLRPRLQPGTDTIQSGIAFGIIAVSGRWSFGLLNQNLFSSQVVASTFQPVLSCQLGESWSVGLGELPFVIDWKTLGRAFVPIGLQLGYLFRPMEQPVRVSMNPQFNARNLRGSSQWTLTTGVSFLFR